MLNRRFDDFIVTIFLVRSIVVLVNSIYYSYVVFTELDSDNYSKHYLLPLFE